MELRKSRRASREIALQYLYSQELNEAEEECQNTMDYEQIEKGVRDVFDMSQKKNDSICEYALTLCRLVVDNKEAIDEMIEKSLTNWEPSELALLDLILLRISTAEIVYGNLPAAISINEAVELAKKYCSSQSSKFINGVLDRVSKSYQIKETDCD